VSTSFSGIQQQIPITTLSALATPEMRAQVVDSLARIAQKAEAAKQYQAANTAWGLIARMHGMLIERSEQLIVHGSIDEIRAALARRPTEELRQLAGPLEPAALELPASADQ
jgi:hypothetical protein